MRSVRRRHTPASLSCWHTRPANPRVPRTRLRARTARTQARRTRACAAASHTLSQTARGSIKPWHILLAGSVCSQKPHESRRKPNLSLVPPRSPPSEASHRLVKHRTRLAAQTMAHSLQPQSSACGRAVPQLQARPQPQTVDRGRSPQPLHGRGRSRSHSHRQPTRESVRSRLQPARCKTLAYTRHTHAHVRALAHTHINLVSRFWPALVRCNASPM